MVQGLSHITFIVRDLHRMEQILTTVLDAKKIYDSGDNTFSISKERFFDIGGVWVATMEGAPLEGKTYNHVAFQMAAEEYDDRLGRKKSLGLDVRSRVCVEGHPIYFYDDDNHLFELHSGSLADRLKLYVQA